MSSVLDTAKALNKKYKKDKGSEVLLPGYIIPEMQRFSLGSLAADYALDGGSAVGIIMEYSGVQFSGKTLGAATAVASWQRQFPNTTCIWVDGEHNFQVQKDFLVKMTGMNIADENKFLLFDTTGLPAEEIFDMLIKLEDSENPGLIVIDSIPSLISRADLDNPFTKDNGMQANIAKILGKLCRIMMMYLPARRNSLLFINQSRLVGKTRQGIPLYEEVGGYAPRFYSTVIVRFGTRKFWVKDNKEATQALGAKGIRLVFSVTKSRISAMGKKGGYLTYSYETGLDAVGDMIEVALAFGFVNKPNNRTYELINLDTGEIYYDENANPLRFVGKDNAIEYITSHEDFGKEYISMLSRHMSGASATELLDEETLSEINNEDSSVEEFTARTKDEDLADDDE